MVMTVFAVLMAKDTQDVKALEARLQGISLDSKNKALDITDI